MRPHSSSIKSPVSWMPRVGVISRWRFTKKAKKKLAKCPRVSFVSLKVANPGRTRSTDGQLTELSLLISLLPVIPPPIYSSIDNCSREIKADVERYVYNQTGDIRRLSISSLPQRKLTVISENKCQSKTTEQRTTSVLRTKLMN